MDKSEALFKYIEKIHLQWEQLQYICELEETKRNYVLGQLQEDDPVKEVFKVLGPDRCKANGYVISKIKEELGVVTFDMTELNDRIYQTFKEGVSYLKSDVKTILQTIFDDCGYKKKS